MKLTKADLQRTAVAMVMHEGGHIYRYCGTLKEALSYQPWAVFLLTGHIYDPSLPIAFDWCPGYVRSCLAMNLPWQGSIVWMLETFKPTEKPTFKWDPARTGPGPSSETPC